MLAKRRDRIQLLQTPEARLCLVRSEQKQKRQAVGLQDSVEIDKGAAGEGEVDVKRRIITKCITGEGQEGRTSGSSILKEICLTGLSLPSRFSRIDSARTFCTTNASDWRSPF